MLQSQILTTTKNKYIARKVIIFWQIYVASGGGYTLPYICAVTISKRLYELYPSDCMFLIELFKIKQKTNVMTYNLNQ